jgi:hypothetical protein
MEFVVRQQKNSLVGKKFLGDPGPFLGFSVFGVGEILRIVRIPQSRQYTIGKY